MGSNSVRGALVLGTLTRNWSWASWGTGPGVGFLAASPFPRGPSFVPGAPCDLHLGDPGCPPRLPPRPVLGDEGIGSSADGRAGHQAQRHVAQGLREVDSCDSLKGQAQGLHVRLLRVGISGARVQDVAAVQDEEEGVDGACLGPQLPGSVWALWGTVGCRGCQTGSLPRGQGGAELQMWGSRPNSPLSPWVLGPHPQCLWWPRFQGL